MKEDVAKVRYPKKVRELTRLEAKAAEIGAYECNSIPGLLQTPEHARALLECRQPAYSPEDPERLVAARIARRAVYDRCPAPALCFVLEGATLRRRVGGTRVRRQQVERLLEVGLLANVTLQVMPMNSGPHAGIGGRIEVLKFADGTAVGRSDGVFNGRPIHEPRQLRILELRYGTIRAQALPPGDSRAFIEQLLGETRSTNPPPGMQSHWRGSRAATAAAPTVKPASRSRMLPAPSTSAIRRTPRVPLSPWAVRHGEPS